MCAMRDFFTSNIVKIRVDITQRQLLLIVQFVSWKQAVHADVITGDGETVLFQELPQVRIIKGSFERAKLAHHVAQFVLARRTSMRAITLENEEQSANVHHLRGMA